MLIGFFCALLVIAGVVYFSRDNFNGQENTQNVVPVAVTPEKEYEAPEYEIFSTAPQTETPKKERNSETFSSFPKELKERFGSALDYLGGTLSISPQNSYKPPTLTALTDEEYFRAVYTGDYVLYLNKLQDLMLADGYIKGGDKIQIKDENDTFLIFNRFVGFLVFKGNITESEGEQLKNGVNVALRQLNAEERPLVEEQLLSSNVIGGLLANLVALVSPAHAAQIAQIKECYRETQSVKGEKPGFNGWASSCNAGYFCSYGCTYFDDCGPKGASCNVQTGCLNGACPNGAAIWDQQTGICGCGTPRFGTNASAGQNTSSDSQTSSPSDSSLKRAPIGDISRKETFGLVTSENGAKGEVEKASSTEKPWNDNSPAHVLVPVEGNTNVYYDRFAYITPEEVDRLKAIYRETWGDSGVLSQKNGSDFYFTSNDTYKTLQDWRGMQWAGAFANNVSAEFKIQADAYVPKSAIDGSIASGFDASYISTHEAAHIAAFDQSTLKFSGSEQFQGVFERNANAGVFPSEYSKIWWDMYKANPNNENLRTVAASEYLADSVTAYKSNQGNIPQFAKSSNKSYYMEDIYSQLVKDGVVKNKYKIGGYRDILPPTGY